MKMIIESNRLIIRHLVPEDFDDLFAICGDADTMRFMGDGRPLSSEATLCWIYVSIQNYAILGYGCSAVIDKSDSRFIGFTGLVRSQDVPGEIELIYALAKPCWGKGLASEAAQAMLRYGLHTLNLPCIYATVDPENISSVKIIEKCGFHYYQTAPDEHGLMTAYYRIDKHGN